MRKPITDQIAQLKAKKDALAAKLNNLEAKAKQANRKRDTRQKIIVGAAVLAHAELRPAFGEQLRAILDKAVERESDREVISEFLPAAVPMSEATAPLPDTVA